MDFIDITYGMLNLQHLYYFWVVAREGSIAKACKPLCLTQPTISSQIIQLEKSLGKQLFDRRQGRLFLSSDGKTVQQYADTIFSQTRDMLAQLATGGDAPQTLTVGIDVAVSSQAASQLLLHLQSHAPRLHLTAEEGTLPVLLNRLKQGRAHLVLSDQMGLLGDSTDALRVEVGRLDMFFVATPEIRAQVKRYPQDLSRVRLLLPVPSSPLWGSIQHFLLRHKIQPVSIMGVQQPGLMRELALKGLGAATLHEIVAADDLQKGTLVRLGRAPTGIRKTLWLLAPKSQAANPIIQHALKTFRIHL